MIDIPLNKALVAVESHYSYSCQECFLYQKEFLMGRENCRDLKCAANSRKDGKNVIFKLVDLPGEEQ